MTMIGSPTYEVRWVSVKPHFSATRSDAAFAGSMMQTERSPRKRSSPQARIARVASVA
jgi:hypothetical protein